MSPGAVETAWAAQYATLTETVDLSVERAYSDALRLIDARQAWQFGVVPLRLEDGELVVATTEDRLARALRFAGWRIPVQCRFVLCDETGLNGALERHYPMAGLNAESMKTLRYSLGIR